MRRWAGSCAATGFPPACRRKWPSPTARRCARGCWARTWSSSATRKGRLGVLDEHCPHRRASLAFGRNEECGLRCLYHGWKFDVDGNVLDMACEPEGSRLAQHDEAQILSGARGRRLRLDLYGAAREMREFEPPAWAPAATRASASSRCTRPAIGRRCWKARSIRRTVRACIRPTCRRRRSKAPRRRATRGRGPRPTSRRGCSLQPTNFGFRYAAIRKPIRDAETHDYVRTTLFIAPFTVLIPPNDQYKLAQMLVPIDDVNTMFYLVAWHPDRPGHRTGGVAQILRGAGGHRSRCGLPQAPHLLPAGPRGDEARAWTVFGGASW